MLTTTHQKPAVALKFSVENTQVRARMAPSPTGAFHIGSARTALFNYLFAKKNNGVFVLRIEDTDKERSKKEWEENIKESLEWLGILPDESPENPGSFGPYRQSQRTEIYKRYLEELINNGNIYRCFCSQEELEAYRQYQMGLGKAPIYSGKCRDLTQDEIQEKIGQGSSFVLRFRAEGKKIKFFDLIRGEIEYDIESIGDFVVAKNIEEPLYNLACVVDDFEMRISHVIRGEEHISNTPRQILIANALGIKLPIYAHLPLILNKNRAKLSKRDPEITAAVLDYKEKGYLPQAVVNFITLLGWNSGKEDKEIFSLADLTRDFSLEKVQKSGAIFNSEKLDWMNGWYIRKMPLDNIANLSLPFLIKSGLILPVWGQKESIPLVYEAPFGVLNFEVANTKEVIDFEYIKKAVAIHQERLKYLGELSEIAGFLFKGKLDFEKELLKWKNAEDKEIKDSLEKSEELLNKIEAGDWSIDTITKVLMAEAEKTGDRGKLLWPLRVALTGQKASAGPFEVANVLGKEKTLQRIKQAIVKL